MKKIMVRAWGIYRHLEGDHLAKLAMALRMAWAEYKKNPEKTDRIAARLTREAKKDHIREDFIKKLSSMKPVFTGSEKQIAWAEDIYKRVIESFAHGYARFAVGAEEGNEEYKKYIERVSKDFLKKISGITYAGQWIESRRRIEKEAVVCGNFFEFVSFVKKHAA